MTIEAPYLAIAFIFAFLLAGALGYLFWKQRKQIKAADKKAASGTSAATGMQPLGMQAADSPGSPASRQMQLQAYERLILLTDRIALPNLIQRVGQTELAAREMQLLLTHSIRQEFEHNITQQIYVSPEAWDAVRNLKEQNMLIINQVASFLPEGASGSDLNRQLLDLLIQNPKASLQNIVSEALSYEAKKLL
jgi:hypothetical protein